MVGRRRARRRTRLEVGEQRLLGLVDPRHLLGRLRVAGIAVGVLLERKPSIGRQDRALRRRARDAQNLCFESGPPSLRRISSNARGEGREGMASRRTYLVRLVRLHCGHVAGPCARRRPRGGCCERSMSHEAQARAIVTAPFRVLRESPEILPEREAREMRGGSVRARRRKALWLLQLLERRPKPLRPSPTRLDRVARGLLFDALRPFARSSGPWRACYAPSEPARLHASRCSAYESPRCLP